MTDDTAQRLREIEALTHAALMAGAAKKKDLRELLDTRIPYLIARVRELEELERYVRGCIPESESIAQHFQRRDNAEAEIDRLRAENEQLWQDTITRKEVVARLRAENQNLAVRDAYSCEALVEYAKIVDGLRANALSKEEAVVVSHWVSRCTSRDWLIDGALAKINRIAQRTESQ